MNHMRINPRKLMMTLVGLSLFFMLMNMAHAGWIQMMGPVRLHEIWSRFDVNQEMSVPTWYSAMLLMAACLTLVVITTGKWRGQDHFRYHWAGLMVIFLGLSIDEVAGFHDLLSERMQSLNLSGPFYYAWVIPGSAFVLLFGAAYLRFVIHLGRRFGLLFAAAGLTYVGGALVLEMVGGKVDELVGVYTLWYQLEVTFEEGFEMLGASLFIYSLLTYLQTTTAKVSIGLSSGVPEPRHSILDDGHGPHLMRESAYLAQQ